MRNTSAKPVARGNRKKDTRREDERTYREIFDSTGDAILVHEAATGKIVDVNKAALRMFGSRSKREIIEKTFRDPSSHQSPFSDKEAKRRLRLAASGKDQVFEWLAKRRNGRTFWVEVSLRASKARKGRRVFAVVRDIEKRKRAEEALRESEERFRSIVDTTAEWIWEIDLKGRHTFSNPTVVSILGYRREEVVGKSAFSLLHPEDRSRVETALPRLQAEKRGWRGWILRWRHKDGNYRFLESNAEPIRDSNGIVVGYRGTDRDITEREQAEEALRESESQLRQLWEATVEGIVIHDQGKIMELNDAMCRMFGVTREQVIGKSFLDFAPEAERDNIRARFASASPERFETQAVRPDGTELTLEVFAKPILYRGKTLRMAASRDITERMRAEKLVLSSEEKYRDLIETIPDGFYRSTPDGRFVDVNPAMVKMLGYDSKEELLQIDIPTDLYFRPDDRIPGETYNQEFIGETEVYQLRKKDGTGIWVEDRSRYLRNESGNIQYHEGVCRDISDRKRKEEEIAGLSKFPSENPDPVLRLSRDGIVMYANLASNRLLEMWQCTTGGSVPQAWRDLAAEALASTSNKTVDVECGDKVYSMFIAPVTMPGYVNLYGRDITERKRAEEALRESENRIKSIFRAAPTGIGSVSNRVVTEANAKFCEMTGYTRDELLGKSARMLYPNQEEFEYVGTEKYRQISETGTGSVETRWQRKDGAIIDVLLSSTPIDPSDLARGVTFTALDITDRKQAEGVLKRYQLLSQNTRDIILFLNARDGTIMEANDAAVRAYGYTREELMKMTIRDLRTPESLLDLPRQFDAANREGLSFETIHRHQNGSTFPVEVSSRGMTFGNERILMSIVRDITERKKAEEALANERSMLRTVINTMPDPIFVKDLHGRTIIANRAEALFCGKESVEEILGHHDEEFLPADVAEHSRKEEERLLETPGGFMSYEGVFTFPDGKERWMVGSKIVLKDAKGEPVGILGVSHDITERKRMEEERKRLDQQIQQSQKLESLGLLAGGIAHDFNNLLSGIFGFVELAKKNIDAGDQAKASERLLKALNVFGRARDLSRQLITFSKGGAPTKTAGDIGRTVSETVQFALSGSNVRCDYAIAPNLKTCSYDPNQISQVIDNIVINAKHAMPQGGLLEVAATNVQIDTGSGIALPNGDYIKISISDHGIGIPQEYLQKIFDPFFTTKHTGSGLGLATCWSIVRRHDGTIIVESEPGKGSTFHIYLPAAEVSGISGGSIAEKNFIGHGTVLVMDDEEPIREILEEMLTDLGYAVQSARDGVEAIELFKKARTEGTPFTLVMLDLTIPGGMGGKDTMKVLLELEKNVRVIASSGYSEDPVISSPREFGFAASIRKPYRKTELVEALVKAHAFDEERKDTNVS